MILDAKPDELEFETIAEQKEQGYSLRHKVFNFGFEGANQLDSDIPIIGQLHWANRDSGYDKDLADFRHAADRPTEGPTKLHATPEGLLKWIDEPTDDQTSPTVANAVCAHLGAVIARTIPEAVDLESIYWTVSDYPNTSGGRLATLNVGSLEVLYVPREPYELITPNGERRQVHISALNMALGTVINDSFP